MVSELLLIHFSQISFLRIELTKQSVGVFITTSLPSGTVGTIVSKWAGTAYSVRLSDGSFRWLDGSEFSSHDPTHNYRLEEGDFGVVTSDHHHHDFAKVGDSFKVFKIAHDMDHYGVLINNEVKWIGGFVLARYM